MGDHPGRLIYHASGYKLAAGVADLPADLRSFTEERAPRFLSAPTEFSRPNESSFSYFRKLLESGQWPPPRIRESGDAAGVHPRG